jgi:hypothetical protein
MLMLTLADTGQTHPDSATTNPGAVQASETATTTALAASA